MRQRSWRPPTPSALPDRPTVSCWSSPIGSRSATCARSATASPSSRRRCSATSMSGRAASGVREEARHQAGRTIVSGTGGTATRVAALLAAYNRRDLTLACLRSLQAQQLPGVTLDLFVLDDASSDGTSEQIAEQFPEVTLLHGNGQLYWNGGMRRAFAAAMAGDYDYYLWMNDDTDLDDGALAVLLDTECRLRARRRGGAHRRRLDQAPGDRRADLRGSRPSLPLAAVEERAGPTGRRTAPLRHDERERGAHLPRRGAAHRQHRSGVRTADGRLRLWAASPGGRLLGLGRPRHGRHLRLPSRASPGRAAPRRGAAAAVVGQGAEARAVGGLQPAVGGQALAPVLAEPVRAPRDPARPRAHAASAGRARG